MRASASPPRWPGAAKVVYDKRNETKPKPALDFVGVEPLHARRLLVGRAQQLVAALTLRLHALELGVQAPELRRKVLERLGALLLRVELRLQLAVALHGRRDLLTQRRALALEPGARHVHLALQLLALRRVVLNVLLELAHVRDHASVLGLQQLLADAQARQR